MRHQWNTRQHYDEHGQRIVAAVRDDCIEFSDLSRHINGVIPLGEYLKRQPIDAYTIENLVMTNYTFGNYSGSLLTLEWKEKANANA